MGSKHNDCCCCPNCTYRVELCCPCVCPAICVTFTPSDPECDPTSVEFDWDESISGYQGSLVGHDLYYYIAREQLTGSDGRKRGKCRFWLRSDSLGYPEGYEMYWEIPCTPDPTVGTATSGENDDPTECTTCLRLGTSLGVPADNVGTSTAVVPCSAGTITTECVNWVTPTNCNNCFCLCECLCAVVKKDGITYTGKLCWDGITGTGTDDPNRWVGTLTGEDSTGSERSLYVEVPVDRWGDVCVGTSTGTGTGTGDCNPDDDSCAISVTITADDDSVYVGDWQRMAEPCELRAVEYSWQIVYPGTSTSTPEDDIYVDIWCAICNEVCGAGLAECVCDDGVNSKRLPKELTLTLTNLLFCSRLDGSYPLTYHTDPEPPTPGVSFFEFWDSPVFSCKTGVGFFFRLKCGDAGVESFTLELHVAPGCVYHTMYFDSGQCNGAFTQDQSNDSTWACATSSCDPIHLRFPDLLEEGVSGGYANDCCQEDHEGDMREPRLTVEVTE